MDEIDIDIAIVGYGPVGQTAAALLARRGHRCGPTRTSSAPSRRPARSPRWSTTCAPSCPSPNRGSPLMSADRVIHPKFHHVNLKTTRLQEMIGWYAVVVGSEVLFEYPFGAWVSNDEANHRIALTAFPSFAEDPEKDTRTGLHHTAFEYASFEELNVSYLRLRGAGIVPAFCLDHGMTFSYCYRDPDGNHVELRCDNFGDWARSSAWMRESPEFHEDPIGKFVDPDRVAEASAAGASFAEIHARAMAGELAPDTPPLELPTVEA